MNARIQLHEAREARDTLAYMLADLSNAIADRHPASDAAQLRALYVADPQWFALTWALAQADERVAELQDMVDAHEAMQRRSIGPFARTVIQQIQP